MPSWEDVRNHLRSRLKVTKDEPTWLGLLWRFPDAQGPVFQEQRVGTIDALGEPHLLVICEAVAEDKLPASELLAHNMTLAVGAVALAGRSHRPPGGLKIADSTDDKSALNKSIWRAGQLVSGVPQGRAASTIRKKI